jgi:hypothetical protein
VAPYFEESEEEQYNVLTDDYGWHRLDNGKYNRWICHHCADHGYAWSNDTNELPDREYKWEEWEEIVKSISPDFLDTFSGNSLDFKEQIEELGMVCERYEEYTQETLQRLYDALAEGKYALIIVPSGTGTSLGALAGHAVTCYGVNENKELLIANSQVHFSNINSDREDKLKYPMSYQNSILPSDNLPTDCFLVNIISLPTA